MKQILGGAPFTALILFTVIWTSIAIAAEPKTINIGWSGGSSWSSLPDRIPRGEKFLVGMPAGIAREVS
jgi:hypothetical protein